MEPILIAVLVGTIRDHRHSFSAAKLVAEVGNSCEKVETLLIDPREYHFPGDGSDSGAKDSKYSLATAKADGFFIVTPEYNHGIPGSLKRMIDSEFDNYFHKAVAFGGVSSGAWGGVRAIEALNTTTRALGLVPTNMDIHFPRVQEIFDDNGKLLDDRYIERISKAWDELVWMTRALKYARANI